MTEDRTTQLSAFAFLIGHWDCDVRCKTSDDKILHNKATWTGRYILDGSAIEDIYRETDVHGNLIRLGMNIRAFNLNTGWTMKWFDAIHSTWLELGPEELGSVTAGEKLISFKHFASSSVIVRITFFDIQEDHFSWKADVTNDQGKTWEEGVFAIEAKRVMCGLRREF